MKNHLCLMLIAVVASSCATQQLYLNVTQPAPVTIAPEIKVVGIIDRSTPTDQTEMLDNLDKVLSLEGTDLDSIGTKEAIRGVNQELKDNDRFSEVRLLSDMKFKATNLGVLPAPLTWDQVDAICRESGTDALFALEMYDTDTKVSYASESAEIKTPIGTIPGIEHIVTMEVLVKTGWRIYSPADRAILDEHVVAESTVKTGRGINPINAIAALSGRKEIVRTVSNKVGRIYAMRLLPYRLQVTRDYYVKGTENFKIAKRRAQLGKWNEAAELWEKETTNPNGKIAGRAHYNMAIINEINGDLENAISWAQKAYEDYNNKLGLDYVRILEDRRYESEILRYQEER